MSWKEFDKYEAVVDKYLPVYGEGETKATQAVTAANKIIYRWFNDGDVFDNVHNALTGWANDLSSYANWLAEHTGMISILEQVNDCFTDDEYEWVLKEMAEFIFDDELLERLDKEPVVGSIYKCDGPFKFVEISGEDDEW